ncbi:hypothetical protein KO520_10205 [Psychrosphaera sp. I2R16]|nr:hypothetical protein [Psychrosphaera sp. I2R16]MBU2882338.1 hypothetical protein [Psychrosphaera sp. I2R16]
MDDVLCNYKVAHIKALKQSPDVPYPQSQRGFFANLEPMAGALSAMEKLYESRIYDPYILTAPSPLNPLCYTEKRLWVEQWLGYKYVERLIISPNKGLLIGDVLIDDHTTGNGQDQFGGSLIHYGSQRFPSWESVLKELNL